MINSVCKGYFVAKVNVPKGKVKLAALLHELCKAHKL